MSKENLGEERSGSDLDQVILKANLVKDHILQFQSGICNAERIIPASVSVPERRAQESASVKAH